MSYIEKNLMEGEKVAYTTRLHWIVLVGPLALCALFGAPGFALLVASANRSGAPSASPQAMMIAGAALLVIFLLGVSFQMHNFWAVKDTQAKMAETVNFTKNMALVGFLLMTVAIPRPWPMSLGR